MTDAATGEWYSDAGVGAAVWDFVSADGTHTMEQVLDDSWARLQVMMQYGFLVPGSGHLFVTLGVGYDVGITVTPPSVDLGAAEVGDTRLTWLARLNPFGYTIGLVTAPSDSPVASPGAVVLDPGEDGVLFYWCQSEAEFQIELRGREQWFIDYDGFREYTPSSGPPARLMFGDMQVLFACIPVVY